MKSESIAKLTEALSKAQGKMGCAKKDSSNPFFKSKYADLESVWEACREALSANGLAVTQTPDLLNDQIVLVTTLSHLSGEWIESRMPLLLSKQDPQALGSAITYARRYALAAMVGIVQTDDDGESAMPRNTTSKKYERASIKQEKDTISEKEVEELRFYYESFPDAEQKHLKFFNLNTIEELNKKDFDKVLKGLKQKKEKENGTHQLAQMA